MIFPESLAISGESQDEFPSMFLLSFMFPQIVMILNKPGRLPFMFLLSESFFCILSLEASFAYSGDNLPKKNLR
jgi:hypothetical protein